jgi:hypothetical protein
MASTPQQIAQLTNSSIVHKALPTVDLRWFHVQSLCYDIIPSSHPAAAVAAQIKTKSR